MCHQLFDDYILFRVSVPLLNISLCYGEKFPFRCPAPLQISATLTTPSLRFPVAYLHSSLLRPLKSADLFNRSTDFFLFFYCPGAFDKSLLPSGSHGIFFEGLSFKATSNWHRIVPSSAGPPIAVPRIKGSFTCGPHRPLFSPNPFGNRL